MLLYLLQSVNLPVQHVILVQWLKKRRSLNPTCTAVRACGRSLLSIKISLTSPHIYHPGCHRRRYPIISYHPRPLQVRAALLEYEARQAALQAAQKAAAEAAAAAAAAEVAPKRLAGGGADAGNGME